MYGSKFRVAYRVGNIYSKSMTNCIVGEKVEELSCRDFTNEKNLEKSVDK